MNLNSIQCKDLKVLVFEFLEALITYENAGEGKEKSYSASTLNARRSCIRKLIQYLYSRDYIEEDFSKYIGNVKTSKKEGKRVLTREELILIKDYLYNKVEQTSGYDVYIQSRNRFLFFFLLFTGCRISEAVKIKWDDIDLSAGELTVVGGKRNKSRKIPIVRDLKLYIYEYKDIVSEIDRAFKDCIINKNVESDYVFPTEHFEKGTRQRASKAMTYKNGEIIIDNIIQNALPDYAQSMKDLKNSTDEKDIERYEQNKITAHSIRHTFASHGIQSGIPVATMSKILGHESVRITIEVYYHEIDIHERKAAMEKLDFGI